ncbi:cell wall hydrolase [Pannonibacter tanglangensis]|uniref:Cell wall hydrolase n=1 Tax=Pannonibacter tanglangensis TaxID=2750084 RepID=A0ABW9ZNP9_9HYPH|nr:cell wall hydrolase [Pannonibacter sp. XCT-34]NBN64365.1 cell wall hydrolase [Pannonibacter sp. XCT-34]
MFGPVYLCGKPFRPRRRYRLRHALALTPLALIALTQPIAVQDVSQLIATQGGTRPKWMASIENSAPPMAIAPTLVLAQAGTPQPPLPAHGTDPGTTTAVQGIQSTTIRGLDEVVKDALPDEVPDEIRINRERKGDRFLSMAPDRAMLDQAAGSVYALSSLLSNGSPQSLPRVAFVKPEPLTKAETTQLAAASAAAAKSGRKPRGQDGEPMDLQKIMMARNAAAASFSLVSAYAPETVEDTRDPFNALFGAQYEEEMPPPEDPENPHWWAQRPLPASVHEPKELRCLAEAIYFEARGEIEEGQVAVGQVVLNRVKNPAYPDTICEVVYQNRHKRNRCQFSFACDTIPDRVSEGEAWTRAQRLARELVAGEQYLKMVDASTHYHATYVRPRWAGQMSKRGKIGLHIFYKTYAGAWN